VLNYVRERSPISRAEISHETELQRSTVSLIVEELKHQGLIEEIEGESTGGRPPNLLRLRAAGPIALGVDIGTKQTMLATSDLAGRVIDRESLQTDPDAETTLGRILECAGRLIKRGKGVEAVGVSVPGLVEPERGNVIFIPHYRWRDWDVAKRLGQATGLPVRIDNDANAAALAELWFGPVACAAGNYECWEAFASERAALARYAKFSPQGEVGLTFSRLVDSALGGEAAARAALVETGRYLGVGISNIIKGLSPKSVIVGGEIARAWPLISEELVKAVEEYSICRGMRSARIIPSTLGETPRLMGALSLVLSSKFAAVTTA
jgi:predicted NBD/HSP70 family sugar kinase